MVDYAYYNGVFCPYDAAVIPLSDRAIFFSEAVYDVVLGANGIAYQLDEHLDRLSANARRIGLSDIPTHSEIKEIIDTLIEESAAKDFLIYLQLSGNGNRRYHARCGDIANLLITVTECKAPDEPGYIKAITLPDNRHGICDIKTTSLLPAVMSIEEAKRYGADIAIFHKDGNVTECSHANVCIVKDGCVVGHPFDRSILPGITQKNLESACDKLGIPYLRREFSTEELFLSDLVMITSTTKLIKVCSEIDGTVLNSSRIDIAERLFGELKSVFIEKTCQKSAN